MSYRCLSSQDSPRHWPRHPESSQFHCINWHSADRASVSLSWNYQGSVAAGTYMLASWLIPTKENTKACWNLCDNWKTSLEIQFTVKNRYHVPDENIYPPSLFWQWRFVWKWGLGYPTSESPRCHVRVEVSVWSTCSAAPGGSGHICDWIMIICQSIMNSSWLIIFQW